MSLLIIILIINLLFTKSIHQIDCNKYILMQRDQFYPSNSYYGEQTDDDNFDTGCRDYVLEYLEGYVGYLQNANIPPGLPVQGYVKEQIPKPPAKLYSDTSAKFNRDSFLQSSTSNEYPSESNGNSYIKRDKQGNIGLNVYMNLELVDLVGIDDTFGYVYANVNLDLFWLDYRLSWNTTLAPVYGVYIDPSIIWTPDITLYNQADGSTIKDVPLLLSHDGSVWSSRQGYLVYNCDLNMLKFPFDVQVCPMKFASFMYTSPSLNLYVNPSQLTSKTQLISPSSGKSISWKTVSLVASNYTELSIYGNYSTAYYTITLKRYSQYYTYTGLLPDILSTVITIVALWVPDINSRMAISVTSLLTVIAVMWTITASIPVTKDQTWIQEYSTFCICIIGLCCCENGLVAYFIGREDDDKEKPEADKRKPPKWMIHIIRVSNLISIIYRRTFLFFVDNCCDLCCILYDKVFPVSITVQKRRKRRKINNFGLSRSQLTEGISQQMEGQHKNPLQARDIEMSSIDQNAKKSSRDNEPDSDDEQNIDDEGSTKKHPYQQQSQQHQQDSIDDDNIKKENVDNTNVDIEEDDGERTFLLPNNDHEEELTWGRLARAIDRISRVVVPIVFASGAIRLLKLSYT